MKLLQNSEQSGFYEFFSDIIFATMAIFVLLLVIFMIFAQHGGPKAQALRALERLEAEIGEATAESERLKGESQSLVSDISKLSKRKVQVAIAVDKSGSMTEELGNLKQAILGLGRILPAVTDTFELTIVAYLELENGQNATSVFPMTTIELASEDGGKSMGQLEEFLSRQRVASGPAPVDRAVRLMLSELSDSRGYDGHQVFMLLGDVGPYEISMAIIDAVTEEGKRRANTVLNDIKNWVNAAEDRNLIVVFSGRDEINSILGGAARRQKHIESKRWFKRVADESGQPDAYTENQARMLGDFIIAALKRD